MMSGVSESVRDRDKSSPCDKVPQMWMLYTFLTTRTTGNQTEQNGTECLFPEGQLPFTNIQSQRLNTHT